MKQSKSTLQATYYSNKETAEKMNAGYIDFLNEQTRNVDLNLISETDADRLILDYQNRLFYYEFAAWEYELKEAIRDFKKAQQQAATFDKAGMMIEEINNTPPKRKKVNHRKSELISKLFRQLGDTTYSSLVSTCKLVPVHLSGKRNFPLPPGEQTDGTQE